MKSFKPLSTTNSSMHCLDSTRSQLVWQTPTSATFTWYGSSTFLPLCSRKSPSSTCWLVSWVKLFRKFWRQDNATPLWSVPRCTLTSCGLSLLTKRFRADVTSTSSGPKRRRKLTPLRPESVPSSAHWSSLRRLSRLSSTTNPRKSALMWRTSRLQALAPSPTGQTKSRIKWRASTRSLTNSTQRLTSSPKCFPRSELKSPEKWTRKTTYVPVNWARND